ncbi:UDP-glycosyltransferase 89A2 [Ziziphus jujuba]|uniref:UDP-glycosyltransferase 89A2 n=1 Tax=Ziziphus jujuba TaxID=326968 RepID=A0A6P4AHN7_ZIZJJ|nr:UDP-glycosyltransferase 89A2 [Ziziphus jujuba]
MSTTVVDNRPHVLVFPYPAQGHSLVLLDLTHQLSLRNIVITILVTPKNLPALDPLLAAHQTIKTLVLPMPPHPKLPPGIENLRDIGISKNMAMVKAMSKLHNPIIQWFESHPNPPVAIISDVFLGWTQTLADQINVRRICFFPNRVAVASVFDYCWRNIDAVSASKVVDFHDQLPDSPSFKHEHLPNIIRRYDGSDPEWLNVRDILVANSSSWGIVFNTFEALEGRFLDHLRKKMGHHRIYGVGPLNLLSIPESSDRGKPDKDFHAAAGGVDVLGWLEGCADDSVLYVCFGSQKFLKREQMKALASGLEQSKTKFIWVVKTGTTEIEMEQGYGVVPNGFEERIQGRGLVVRTWVPQLMILNHRAVWGFLSYSGWNSLMEGITAGVMLLIWPMEADHYINAKLLEEEMGVAIKVCEGDDGVPDSAELGKVIDESMRNVDGPQRVKVKELRDKTFQAVSDGGPSRKDLDELVKELRLL